MTERVIRVSVEDATAGGATGVKRNLSDISAGAKESANLLDEMKMEALGAIGAFLGFETAKETLMKLIEETSQSSMAFARLDSIVQATGASAGYSAQSLADMAEQFSAKTIYSTSAIESMEAALLGFEHISGEVFERASQAALDLASRMGGDATSAAILLGKALNQPADSLEALQRAGIQFDATEKDLISTMAKSGDLYGAQIRLLSDIEKQSHGAAAALHDSFGGALAGLKNSASDLFDASEHVGFLTSSMHDLTDTLSNPEVKAAFQSFAGLLLNAIALPIVGITDTVAALILELSRGKAALEDFMGASGDPQNFGNPATSPAQTFVATDSQTQLVKQLTDAYRDQAAVFEEQAKNPLNYAHGVDEIQLKMRLLREELSATNPLQRQFLTDLEAAFGEAEAHKYSAAIESTTSALRLHVQQTELEIEAGPRAADALRRHAVEVENLKNDYEGLTSKQTAFLDQLDDADQTKYLDSITRQVADQTASIHLQATVRSGTASALREQQFEQDFHAMGGVDEGGSMEKQNALLSARQVLMRQFAETDAKYISDLQDQISMTSQSTHAEEIANAQRQLSIYATQAQRDAVRDLVDELDAAKKVQSEYADEARTAAGDIQSAFADFLFNPLDGGFKKMLKSWVDTLSQMVAKAEATHLFAAIAKDDGGLGGWLEKTLFGVVGGLGSSALGLGALGGGSSAGINTFAGAANDYFDSGLSDLHFASGGEMMVGGNGGTDSQDIRFKATPGEKVIVQTPDQQRQRAGQQPIVLNIEQHNYQSGLGVTPEQLDAWGKQNNEALSAALMEHLRRLGTGRR